MHKRQQKGSKVVFITLHCTRKKASKTINKKHLRGKSRHYKIWHMRDNLALMFSHLHISLCLLSRHHRLPSLHILSHIPSRRQCCISSNRTGRVLIIVLSDRKTSHFSSSHITKRIVEVILSAAATWSSSFQLESLQSWVDDILMLS